MPSHHEIRAVNEQRNRAIYRAVRVEGRPLPEVAARYDLSTGRIEAIVRQVERHLARLYDEQSPPEPPEVLRLHLLRVEHQWQEAMLAWYRSLQDVKTTRLTRDDGRNCEQKQLTARTQVGNVRFLEHARRLLAEIRLLQTELSRHTHSEERGDVESLTPEQRELELLGILSRLRERAREDAAGGAADRGAVADDDAAAP